MNNNIYLIGNENDLKDSIMIKKQFNYNFLSIINLPLAYYPFYKSIENNKLKHVYKYNIYNNSAIKSISNEIKPIPVNNKLNNYYLEFHANRTTLELSSDLHCKLLLVGASGYNLSTDSGYSGQVLYLESYKFGKGKYTIYIPSDEKTYITKDDIVTVHDNLQAKKGFNVEQLRGINYYKYKTLDNYKDADISNTNNIRESQYIVKNIGNYYNKIFNYDINSFVFEKIIKKIEPIYYYKFDDSTNIGKDTKTLANLIQSSGGGSGNPRLLGDDNHKYLLLYSSQYLSSELINNIFNINFSISFWIKINTTTASHIIKYIYTNIDSSETSLFEIKYNSNNISLNLYTQNLDSYYISITSNTWHYITITFELIGSNINIKFYKDGNDVYDITKVKDYNSNLHLNSDRKYKLIIGNLLQDSYISELKFFNSVLTKEYIKQLYYSANNYIKKYLTIDDITRVYLFWYKFASKSTIGIDSSDNNQDFNQDFNSNYSGTEISNTYVFNNGYITQRFNNKLFCKNKFSLSFRFKVGETDFNNTTKKSILLSVTNDRNYKWMIYYFNKSLYFSLINGNINNSISIEKFNVEYNIAITLESDNSNSYIIKMYNINDNKETLERINSSSYISSDDRDTDNYNFNIGFNGTYGGVTYEKMVNSYLYNLIFMYNYIYTKDDINKLDNRDNLGRVIIEYMKSDDIIEDDDKKQKIYDMKSDDIIEDDDKKEKIYDIEKTQEITDNYNKEFDKILKKFDDEDKPYNTFNILPIVILIIIGWVIIILIILKFVSHYYSFMYIYIIIYTIIILLFISSLWFIFVNNI